MASPYAENDDYYDEYYDEEEYYEEEEEEVISVSSNRHPEVADESFVFTHRPDTTETFVEVPDVLPDINLVCEVCSSHIKLPELSEHRKYHTALEKLKYSPTDKPKTLQLLLRRRKNIISALKKELKDNKDVLFANKVSELNSAFDLLKSYLDGTYDVSRGVLPKVSVEDVEGQGLSCSVDCIRSIGVCSTQNHNWRDLMEDTKVVQDFLGNDRHKCYAALFDGFGGSFAAEVAANELHFLLLQQLIKVDPSTRCTCTVNMAEVNNTREEIHSRVTTSQSERTLLHAQSENLVQQILHSCEDKLNQLFGAADGDRYSARLDSVNKKKQSSDPLDEKIAAAFESAYLGTDMLLNHGQNESSKVRWSGCAGLSVIVRDITPETHADKQTDEETGKQSDEQTDKETNEETDKQTDEQIDKQTDEQTEEQNEEMDEHTPVTCGRIHLANLGNVRAVLVRGNHAYQLARDHSAANPKERNRIVKAGGELSPSAVDSLLSGVLPVTRGLGNHGDPELKELVLNSPYCRSVDVDQYCQFLVLATRGLWQVFNTNEVTKLVIEELPSNYVLGPRRPDPSLLELLQAPSMASCPRSFESHRQKTDNSSSVVTSTNSNSLRSTHSNQTQSHSNKSDAHSNQSKPPSNQSKSQSNKSISSSQTSRSNKTTTKSVRSDQSQNKADMTRLMTSEAKDRMLGKRLAEKLVKAALMAGSQENISVIVMVLPAAGADQQKRLD